MIEALPQGPIKPTWHSAGWLQIFGPEGARIQARRILLGKSLIGLSSLAEAYTLSFEAKRWLPPLQVSFWAKPREGLGLLPGDVKRYQLTDGRSEEIAPGAWQTVYTLQTGLGQRSFAVVEAYLARPGDDDEAIDVATRRIGVDNLQITLITESRPPDNSVEILIAVASN